jgi:hypothetical protein
MVSSKCVAFIAFWCTKVHCLTKIDCQTKAVLWPDINHLVESHYLTERSEITVTDYFVRWNEGSTNELLPFFVIKSLTVDAPSHTLTPYAMKVTWDVSVV